MKFKIGETVTLLDIEDTRKIPDYSRYIGKIGKVEDVSGTICIKMEDGGHISVYDYRVTHASKLHKVLE